MPLKLSQAPVLTYGSVTSTMDVARYLVLGSGKSNPIREIPFAVQSAEQLKGRGRLSSDWHSPTGNLYTSILLRPKLRPEHMALTSFAVVLALYDCIQANAVGCDPLDLKVKWPNDLLLEGGKIAGLLLEALPDGVLMVGLGLNLKSAPKLDNKAYKAQDLSAFIDLGAADFLRSYLKCLEVWIEDLEQNGFANLRQTWLNRAYGIGKQALVRLPKTEIKGTIEGIDRDGHLLLKVAGSAGQEAEVRSIAAGSVFF